MPRAIHPLAGQGINADSSDVRVLAEGLVAPCVVAPDPRRYGRAGTLPESVDAENALMQRAMQGFRRLYGAPDQLDLRLLHNVSMSLVHRSGPLKRVHAPRHGAWLRGVQRRAGVILFCQGGR
ncbi:MAG: hypothetical protein IPO61_07145 [Gammaproteobacteria bacterium]|nr:hypothetical protein [Gammaproteobacteria bacterium]